MVSPTLMLIVGFVGGIYLQIHPLTSKENMGIIFMLFTGFGALLAIGAEILEKMPK